MRGQLAYASDELKAQERVPLDIDPSDDVVVAESQLLVTIDAMAAEAARWVAQGHGTGATGAKCAYVYLVVVSMMCPASIGLSPPRMIAEHRLVKRVCEHGGVLQAQRCERQRWACAAQPPLRPLACTNAACRARPPGEALPARPNAHPRAHDPGCGHRVAHRWSMVRFGCYCPQCAVRCLTPFCTI